MQAQETIEGAEGDKTSDGDKKVRKRKKKTSKVWLEFTEVDLKNGENNFLAITVVSSLLCNIAGQQLISTGI